MKEEQMREVAGFIDRVLSSRGEAKTCAEVREAVLELTARYVLPH
jgi:glycine/serine hydroxymethyltransferase